MKWQTVEYLSRIPRQPSHRFERIARFVRLSREADGAVLWDYVWEKDGREDDPGEARMYRLPASALSGIERAIASLSSVDNPEAAFVPGDLSAGGISLSVMDGTGHCFLLNPFSNTLCARLLALAAEEGEPAGRVPVSLTFGTVCVSGNSSSTGEESPAKTKTESPLPEGPKTVWRCAVCGAGGNTGKFCFECGSAKP